MNGPRCCYKTCGAGNALQRAALGSETTFRAPEGHWEGVNLSY